MGDLTPHPDEAAALRTLKTRLNDRAYPSLDLARVLQTHLKHYPQSIRMLAEKLGIPGKRTYLSDVISLGDVPLDQQVLWKGKVISARTIRKLVNVDQYQAVDQGVDHPSFPSRQGVDHSVDQSNTPVDHSVDHPRFDLLRVTIDGFVRLIWTREIGLGALAELWAIRLSQISWLRIGLSIVALVLVGYGGWSLGQDVPRWIQSRKWAPAILIKAPAPQLTGSRWIAGHKLELRWNPTGPQDRYQIYWHSKDGQNVRPIAQGELKTPGARISIAFVTGRGFITVTAINPRDEESAHSEKIAFDPEPVNDRDDVEALPLEGIDAVKRGRGDTVKRPVSFSASPRLPVSASSLLPPAEVHAEVRNPDLIILSWRAVSKDAQYNVYSSATRDLAALRKENDRPLKSNRVEWTPETGKERYWVVVTTLDPAGKESAYSEAIEVVRRPEKSGSSGAEEAAGILRKVLPW
jgi:hypothetical protein